MLRRHRSRAALVVVGLLVAGGLGLHMLPRRAQAEPVYGPVRVGVSFSPLRAAYLGLDYRDAFRRLESMGFKVIRVPVSWQEVQAEGYDTTDWLVADAAARHQPLVLVVGMKGLGWPEFYIPPDRLPRGVVDGGDVSQDPLLRSATLNFIQETVERYRDNPIVVAWQVENEPLNQAGPHKWWIGASFLQEEVRLVRSLDSRPLVLSTFQHFNLLFDQATSRFGLSFFDGDSAEKNSLALLQPGDVLGLDAYTRIGYTLLGGEHVAHAGDGWADRVGRWRTAALEQGRQAWVTESQAEPWEASMATYATPRSFAPGDLEATYEGLKDQGFGTILLWGSEYWLWRAQAGDQRWLQAVERILREEAKAPSMLAL